MSSFNTFQLQVEATVSGCLGISDTRKTEILDWLQQVHEEIVHKNELNTFREAVNEKFHPRTTGLLYGLLLTTMEKCIQNFSDEPAELAFAIHVVTDRIRDIMQEADEQAKEKEAEMKLQEFMRANPVSRKSPVN